MRGPLLTTLGAVVGTVSPPLAAAQDHLFTVTAHGSEDWVGRSVSDAGDVNGDGFADVIVGMPKDDGAGVHAGAAEVWGGPTGTLLHRFVGENSGHQFGISVSAAGDVNGDGYDDVIVGARHADDNGPGSGSASIFSGLDGALLRKFVGDSAGDDFGFAVHGVGDVNGDGHDDVIIGAPHDGGQGQGCGRARVYSGRDGTVLHTFWGDAEFTSLGYAVGAVGDVNGDGVPDVIVGLNRLDVHGKDSGGARVYSGLDGALLHEVLGDGAEDELGASVAGAGDVDGDGVPDFIVGTYDWAGHGQGYARVFSGDDGSLLHDFDGAKLEGGCLGTSVDGLGDVNGDGFDDVIVGVPRRLSKGTTGQHDGGVRVFSGADGATLYTFDGSTNGDELGFSVSRAGDVDGDGVPDFVVGAWHGDIDVSNGGYARIVSGAPHPVGTSYCGPAVANSTGLPAEITALGSDVVQHDLFGVRATGLPPGEFGYYLVSETPGFVANPGGSQGNLCLAGEIGRFVYRVLPAEPSGTLAIGVAMKKIPPPAQSSIQAGETWHFQAWYRDHDPGPTSNFTDAVAVLFN